MEIVTFINKLPEKEHYFQFIIDNYVDGAGSCGKLMYTYDHFVEYLSKELTDYYELAFLINKINGEVLASIIITRDIIITPKRNTLLKSLNYYYLNFATVNLKYRNKGYIKYLLSGIIEKYYSEFNLIYGITFHDSIEKTLLCEKQINVYNLLIDAKIPDESIICNKVTSLNTKDFVNKKIKNKTTDYYLKVMIKTFSSNSKFYLFLRVNEIVDVVIYYIQVISGNTQVMNYYLQDSTSKLTGNELNAIINYLPKNAILNVPDFILKDESIIANYTCLSKSTGELFVITTESMLYKKTMLSNIKLF